MSKKNDNVETTKVTKEEWQAALKTIKRYYNETLKHIHCTCCAPVRGTDDRCFTCGGALEPF